MRLNRASALAALAFALAAGPAGADTSVAVVAVSGTVSGAPESVVFTGEARIQNRLAPDPDFNSPNYVIVIDLSGVSGVGALSARKYAISGPEIVQKKVSAAHVVNFTFPFEDGVSAPRAGKASFSINFDPATGAITAAVGSLSAPSF